MGLSLILLTSCSTLPAEGTNAADAAFVAENELVNRTEVVAIVVSPDAAISLERKASRWGYGLKKKESLSSLNYHMLTFDCPPGIDPHVASREIEAMEAFVTVEVNHKYMLQDVRLEDFIKAPQYYADDVIQWPSDGCEANAPVGIIDSGVDVNHPKLRRAEIVNESFIPVKEMAADTRHGTAIAEILVGEGRLKNTQLYSAAVVSKDENGESYAGIGSILKAIDWQVSSGVKVVNISLAGPYNKTLERVIDRITSRGVIIVAAVGNSGPNSAARYPAALDNVIAATAIDSDLNVYKNAVRGDHVDFAAPGVDVYVGDGYGGRYVTGTSIASPFIAARIAAEPKLSGKLSPDMVKKMISASVKDLGDEGRDPVFGDGLINLNQRCD
jgi:subtilisin family serine protease